MWMYFLDLFCLYKWISNLLACLLLPIKMEEWGPWKMIKEKKEKEKREKALKYNLNWMLKKEH